MIQLMLFELEKIWRKRSFILSMCVLLMVNLFLLWYVNMSDDETPPLGAYKAFSTDIQAMSEEEKGIYITKLKERMDGITFVQSIQNLQANGGDMETELAQQKLKDNKVLFDKYYGLYQSGEYLIYTDSLSQESAFVNELFDAYQKVAAFPKYLDSVVTTKNTLNSISIFKEASTDSFSSQNIIKSAQDYSVLSGCKTIWQVDKGIVIAMENRITDILLFLAVFLFVGSLITRRKRKKFVFYNKGNKKWSWLIDQWKIGSFVGSLYCHCRTNAGSESFVCIG